MRFSLQHAVGSRERWKTSNTLTERSALVIADEVAAIDGVTGVTVNPRTGSVILTVDSYETKKRTASYFGWLASNPPLMRRKSIKKISGNNASANLPAAAGLLPLSLIDRAAQAAKKGFERMPVLVSLKRFRTRLAEAFDRLQQRADSLQLPSPAKREIVPADDGELDFSSLARYVFLRPVLPAAVNVCNAVLGAIPLIIEGFKNLFQGKLAVPGLDAAALLISIVRRDFRTVGLLVLLLGLGDMLEKFTRKKSLDSLAGQLALKVDRVWIRRPGNSEEGEPDGLLVHVPLSEVTEKDVVVVRSGSIIPVDGIVLAGDASVNQATMTGEPLPVHRAAGGSVFAGTVVEDGEIDIRPTAVGGSARLSQIVDFIETSEKAKAGIQGKAEHLADAIVPYNFLLAGLVWLFTRSLTRTASVLLVDYSCALKLATPLAILNAMRVGTQKGVLVKGGRYLEAMAEVDTVVFDKTGTLTQASPVLSDVVALDPEFSEDELLKFAACLEEHFPHPVSRAVVRSAEACGLSHAAEEHDTEVRYIVAHGICSSVEGRKCVLGSRHFIEDDEGIDVSAAKDVVERLASEGKSILYFAVGDKLAGVLGIEDPLRPEAAHAVEELRRRGIKTIVMLTGDDERTAAAVANRLKLDGFKAQVLPHEKAEIVETFAKSGAKVLMVGDGINDSPALSAAHVGATLRDGTDIAQEVADVVLTENSLMDLPAAIDLSRAAMKRIKQNFAFSVGFNSVFLAGGLAGLLTPAAGALLHNATTIGVCFNAMQPPTCADKEKHTLAERLHNVTEGLAHTLEHIERMHGSAPNSAAAANAASQRK